MQCGAKATATNRAWEKYEICCIFCCGMTRCLLHERMSRLATTIHNAYVTAASVRTSLLHTRAGTIHGVHCLQLSKIHLTCKAFISIKWKVTDAFVRPFVGRHNHKVDFYSYHTCSIYLSLVTCSAVHFLPDIDWYWYWLGARADWLNEPASLYRNEDIRCHRMPIKSNKIHIVHDDPCVVHCVHTKML